MRSAIISLERGTEFWFPAQNAIGGNRNAIVHSLVRIVYDEAFLKSVSTGRQGKPLPAYYVLVITNNVPSIPTESEQSDARKTTKSRMRRIMTGEEVLLTPESVDDLAILPLASPCLVSQPETVPTDLHSTERMPITVLSGLVSSSILSPLPTPLAHRPKWGTVSSGSNAGLEYRFLGSSVPFSAFPGGNEEPVPKQLLIHYCEFLFKLSQVPMIHAH